MTTAAALKAALAALPRAIAPRMATALGVVAEDAAAEAKRHLPAGPLADSIASEVDADTGMAAVIVGAPYAPFVEYGTRHAAGQPFLRPAGARAVQEAAGPLAAAYAEAVTSALDGRR